MNWKLTGAVAGAALLADGGPAAAEGELNIFNWGDYTSPELIKKFEDKYKVKVTITDYDSNDTALAKVRAGGHGFDIVVPSANFMPIWISEGLLLETRPDQMENFKNVDPEMGRCRLRSGPPILGAVAVGHRPASLVNTRILQGRHQYLGHLPRPAGRAEGQGQCRAGNGRRHVCRHQVYRRRVVHGDKDVLKKVRDKLMAAKPNWIVDGLWHHRKICARATSGRRRQLERLGLPRAAAEPGMCLRLSQGRLRHLGWTMSSS